MSEELRVVTIEIKGMELKFLPTEVAYNQFLNDCARKSNVVGAMRDYVSKIVAP